MAKKYSESVSNLDNKLIADNYDDLGLNHTLNTFTSFYKELILFENNSSKIQLTDQLLKELISKSYVEEEGIWSLIETNLVKTNVKNNFIKLGKKHLDKIKMYLEDDETISSNPISKIGLLFEGERTSRTEHRKSLNTEEITESESKIIDNDFPKKNLNFQQFSSLAALIVDQFFENNLNDNSTNDKNDSTLNEFLEDVPNGSSDEDSDGNFSDESKQKQDENSNKLSIYEEQLIRESNKIEIMEKNLLKSSPWELSGEIDSTERPVNSLLQEIAEPDSGKRLAPVVTMDATSIIEEKLKSRISSLTFDNCESQKKIELDENFSKAIVLDHQKSKESLSQIYEKEYLRSIDTKNVSLQQVSEMSETDKILCSQSNEILNELEFLSDIDSNIERFKRPNEVNDDGPLIEIDDSPNNAVLFSTPSEISDSKKNFKSLPHKRAFTSQKDKISKKQKLRTTSQV